MKKFEKSASRRRFFRGGLIFGGGLLAVPVSQAAPANETLKAIHSLRTIHGDFSDKPVPDESVQTILDASVRAANASNSQTYSIIVSRDPAKIQKLTGYRATCLLLYCSDHTRPADVAKHLGDPFRHFFAVHEFTGEIDNQIYQQVRWVRLEDLTSYDFLAADRGLIRDLAAGKLL